MTKTKPVKKTSKAARSKRKPICLFCQSWRITDGTVLFTITDKADSGGICAPCVELLHVRLLAIVEAAVIEANDAIKH